MKRPRSRKPERPPPAPGRSSGSSAAPTTTLSPGRKWLLRLLAVLIPPLILVGGLELLLRLLGFGYEPHFFKSATIGGKECYIANDDFGFRFFPRSLARIPPAVVMPATKAPDSYRIFIFGESAALGDPRPNYGAGCYLQALLTERFPEAKFEIINTSITAINSHVILPIARECARHEGDLWLIYMGNNEMVGPFGAATVFGARTPPLWLIRAQLQLQRLRLGQLLFEVSRKLRTGDNPPAGWQGMEMFVRNQLAPDDPRKQSVYRNFERNLGGILKAGLASGAKVVLSTVAVNLKDCPPFGSVCGADLSLNRQTNGPLSPGPSPLEGERGEASGATYDRLCRDGTAAEAQGRYADAKADFQRATEICPQSAEAQFRLATCLLRATNAATAESHFQQAVDTDALPFRADSRINQSIRAAARQFACESLALCDAAEALSAKSFDHIAGEESFYEHVHLNPSGNYELALVWAEQVEKLLAPALKRGARPSWISSVECDRWLGLTDWNRVSILEEVLGRMQHPPFSGQSGNPQRVARLQDQIAELRQHLTTNGVAQARGTYLQALHRAPQDFRLHENYAEFLEAIHELNPAVKERKTVCDLLPFYYFPWYALGVTLKDAGALTEARQALLKAAALRPEQGQVRLELGIVCAREGEWESARRYLDEARQLSPDDPRTPLYLGEVLWKLERRSEAMDALRDAIRLAPLDWQPHYRLASDLAQQSRFSEAAAEYREALRLNPTSVKTKLGLSAVLLSLGREAEALQQLDEALQLEPNNQAALEFRRKLRGS